MGVPSFTRLSLKGFTAGWALGSKSSSTPFGCSGENTVSHLNFPTGDCQVDLDFTIQPSHTWVGIYPVFKAVLFHNHSGMTNPQKQQAHRNSAKAKLSVIKAKLKAKPKEQVGADRQAERLRRLLTDYPFLSTQFDIWMDSRREEIKQMRMT